MRTNCGALLKGSGILLRLIVPASDIPDRTVVTKATGTAELVFRTHVTLFTAVKGEKAERQVQHGPDIRFLVNPDTGDVNVISKNLRLALNFDTYEELQDWLDLRLQE